MNDTVRRIAFIGFGEAAGRFARDFPPLGLRDLAAYDIAFAAPDSRQAAAAEAAGVRVARDTRDAVAGADLVISAVTAGAALDAARAIAGALDRGAFVVDINSVAPATKTDAGALIAAAGGRYVEAAVMAAVPPYGLKVPMLLGGPHAPAFLAACAGWPLAARPFSATLGEASAVKMCRSIMIKGIEALMLECITTAGRYGVVQDVIGSLEESFPGQNWPKKATYLASRALIHGKRRAEEMREVEKTVVNAGCAAVMTPAIVAAQDRAAGIGAAIGRAQAESAELDALLRAIDAVAT